MAYEGDKIGREVAVVNEYSVSVHKCPKCGMTFEVTAMILEHEENYGDDYWTTIQQIPNYCYMCGAEMDGGDDVDNG